MTALDEETERLLVQSADDFADASHDLARIRALRDSGSGFAPDVWRAMGEMGWPGMLLPEDLGGSGLSPTAGFALAEMFGKRLMPEPLVPVGVIAATILAHSSAPAARSAARALAQGGAVTTLAFQERLGQLDPAAPDTRLDPNGSEYRLTGRKLFVPAWTDDASVLVTATSPRGFGVVLIDARAGGMTAEPRQMSDGTLSADLRFDGTVIVPEQVVLVGHEAEAAVRLAILRGILGTCAQLAGIGQALLTMTAEYVRQRVQFERPLAAKQALRHRLADLRAQLELASASWRAAATQLETGDGRAEQAVSSAKARCSDTAVEIGRSAIQYHGAFGYTEEADVGLFVNAALRLAAYLGNAGRHRQRALELHLAEGEHDG